MTDEERTPDTMRRTGSVNGINARYADIGLAIVSGHRKSGTLSRGRKNSGNKTESDAIANLKETPQTEAFTRMVAECRAKLEAGVPEEELMGGYSALVRKAAKA